MLKNVLNNMITLGLDRHDKESVRQQTELLNSIVWLALLLVSFSFLFNIYKGTYAVLAVDGPVLLLILLVLGLNYYKKTFFSRFLTVVGFSVIFLGGNLLTKFLANGEFRIGFFFADRFFLMLNAVFPVIFLDFEDEKKSFWTAVIFGFCCFAAFEPLNNYFGYDIVSAAGDPRFTADLQLSAFTGLFAWIGLFFGVFYLKRINTSVEVQLEEKNKTAVGQKEKLDRLAEKNQIHNEELRQQSEELTAQRDFIEDQNNSLKSAHHSLLESIRSARHIQQAILPAPSEMAVLGEYFVYFRPCDIVSGDCYWIHQCPEGEILLAGIDCTGHGIPGAFMTLIADTELSKIAGVEGIIEPSEILEELRLNLNMILNQEQTHNADGMDMGIVRIEKGPEDTLLTYSGAKFSLFYCLPDRKEVGQLKGNRINIGGRIKEDKYFSQEELRLPPGSFVYIGSDGIRDQNNETGEKFGSDRLLRLMEEIKHEPARKQLEILEKNVSEFMKQSPQRDDMLLLGFRI